MSPPTARAATWILLCAGTAALGVLCLSFLVSPEAIAQGEPFASLGLSRRPCPGCPLCGMSRAFASASRGEVARAVAFNPGVVALYPAFWLVALVGVALPLRSLVRSRQS